MWMPVSELNLEDVNHERWRREGEDQSFMYVGRIPLRWNDDVNILVSECCRTTTCHDMRGGRLL
ncbi:hypothetical protein M752DRAFT_273302 [Aspergillus phoenicis ATCC 13157]|uniref:Uncharacterized protein n=1 Tax=Aspergillus phoenicis ATCC 13157 TaxID=1353007 RepID=A0A370PVH5_ASPPH|nr:hypothetical protein M752DRAFT_273302 [Aspergillus phoenicis ATCC 13157]